MTKEKIEKHYLLIYNDCQEVLVLKDSVNDRIYIPTIRIIDKDSDKIRNTRYYGFVKSVVDEDKLQLLYENRIEYIKWYKESLVERDEVRKIFSIYHNLKREEILRLMVLSEIHSFEPYMMKLDEVLDLLYKEHLPIEKEIINATKILKKKLKYKLY